MTRVYNFSAGPSQLPTEVLQKCAAELMEYGISGQSVMEMSHRSSSFLEIIETTELRLRSLLRGFQSIIKCCFCRAGHHCSLRWYQ